MNKTIEEILKRIGLEVNNYIYIDKTCDNIKLKHKASGKEINVRW